MEKRGMHYKVRPFLSMKNRVVLYSKGNIAGKVLVMLRGYMRRAGDLFILPRYDYVYIHRWAATAGPP